MPIGTTQTPGLQTPGAIIGNPALAQGEVRSAWAVAQTNTSTAQSASDLLNVYAIDDATCQPVAIPAGATRFIARLRIPAAVTTYTTSPVIRFVGMYGTTTNGSTIRLDNVDSSAAGVTITGTAADLAASDGSERSDPTNLVGYPTMGCDYLICPVETACVYTDGATPQVVPLEILFLS